MKQGFTLLELLVVLVVMGGATAIALPSFRARQPGIYESARKLEAVVNSAVRLAANRGQPGRILVNFKRGRYWVGAYDNWPTEIWVSDTFNLTAGVSVARSEQKIDLIVLPTGSIRPDSVIFTNETQSVLLTIGANIGDGIESARRWSH